VPIGHTDGHMYIFIDESGTHKQHGRSSIALIYLSIENIELFDHSIIKIERQINTESFHWTNNPWPIKEKFIDGIATLPMTIKIALIKNPFYANEAYAYALRHLVIEKSIKAIIIDGKKEKSYGRKLKKAFRDKNIGARKLRTANDASYPGLRVADVIAGLVRYRYDNPGDIRANKMYKKIAKKIVLIVEQ
jgi:hypothetical protein